MVNFNVTIEQLEKRGESLNKFFTEARRRTFLRFFNLGYLLLMSVTYGLYICYRISHLKRSLRWQSMQDNSFLTRGDFRVIAHAADNENRMEQLLYLIFIVALGIMLVYFRRNLKKQLMLLGANMLLLIVFFTIGYVISQHSIALIGDLTIVTLFPTSILICVFLYLLLKSSWLRIRKWRRAI